MAKFSVEQALRRARSYAQKGDADKARELYNGILKEFPQNQKARKALSKIGTQKSKVKRKSPPQATIKDLVSHLNQGQNQRVLAEAKALSLLYPDSFVVWNFMGAAYHRLGQLPAAAKSFQRSCELNPKFADGFNNLGVALVAQGRADEAISRFRRAVELKPGYVDAYNNLGSIYFKQNQLDQAVECFKYASDSGSNNVEAFSDLGLALQRQGKIDQAISIYERALAIQPDHAGVLTNLGSALAAQGKPKDGLTHYLSAMEIDPKFGLAHINVAKLPVGLVKSEVLEKLEKLSSSSAQSFDDINFKFFQANILRHKGKTSESFDFICEANRMMEDREKIQSWRERMAATEKELTHWSPENSFDGGISSYKLLFILGPSRSGKSTVERILSEIPGFARSYEGWRGRTSMKADSASLNEAQSRSAVTSQSKSRIENFLYFEEEEVLAQGIRILSCTHPSAIHSLHSLYESFENAFFVFVQRDPIETASEVFAQEYRVGNHYSYNPNSALEYVERYNRLSQELTNKLAKRAMSVRYQDVLDDPTAVARKIENLLGQRLFKDSQKFPASTRPRSSIYAPYFKEYLRKSEDT